MSRRTGIEGAGVVLAASALGVGAWLAAVMVALATVLPLHLDVSWIRLVAWGLASGVALVAVALVTREGDPTRGARGALGVLGAAVASSVVWAVGSSYDLPPSVFAIDVVGGLGGLIALSWAVKPWCPRRLVGRARVVTAAVTGLASLGWGSATLWDFAEEHASQVLPAHQLELVAAYPYSLAPTGEPGSMPAVVVDASGQPGDVIALGGEDWNVHRGDALSLSPTDVPRIRWIDAGEVVGISIRLEGEARAALDARSRSRSSQYDALYVDGEPLALVFYFGSEPGRLVLMDTDRAHLHQVYRRLTR